MDLFISELLISANHSLLHSHSYSILVCVKLLSIIMCFKSLLHFLQLYGPRLDPNPDVSKSAGISNSSRTVFIISTHDQIQGGWYAPFLQNLSITVPPCMVAGQNESLSTLIESQYLAVSIASSIACFSDTRIGFTKTYAFVF